MSGISFSTVSQAAASLRDQGHRISVRSVIKELGGGSPNTVAPLLKEWRSINEIEGAPVELDPRLGLVIQEMIENATRKAVAQARETIEVLNEDMGTLTQALETAVKRTQELELEIGQAHALVDEYERHLSESQLASALEQKHHEQEVESLKSALLTERRANISTSHQLVKAQAHLEDRDELKSEVMRLRPYEQKVTALEATVASQKALIIDLQARLERAYKTSEARS